MVKLEHLIPVLLILVGVQIAATYLSIPVKASEVTAFGDPESLGSPFIYLGMVILLTGVILVLFRTGFKRFITWFFLITVWATTSFVTLTLVEQYTDGTNTVINILAFTLPFLAAFLIWKFPEWYVIDTIGFVECVGATAIIGVSFGIIPIIIVLTIFAIYDAISVYKTKHMQTLAESVLTEKLPALFIIPKDRNFSYLNSSKWTDLDDIQGRQTYIIGMGDIIFPSTMVVSASAFISGPKLWGILTVPAIGAMIGSCIGLIMLHWYAARHPRAHAGLPLLNSFTILGFVIAYGITVLYGV
jgi:presenilin-like A22 family membrane protease